MEKRGGIYLIPCDVNGLSLKFIFDTGASDVSISLTEALFMLKNGYLKESDIKGRVYYSIANGEIAEGTKINIQKIVVGKQTLSNVEASIVHSAEAPLLFGQSAMQRFGKFTFDYANSNLIIGNATIIQNSNLNKAIVIGSQTWMSTNLNVDHFRNGDSIPEAKSTEEWIQAGERKQPAWCYYNNDSKNGSKYGRLYNWYAVNDKRGLAPYGWHIPSDQEWNFLIDFLGGDAVAGRKMKSIYGWDSFEDLNGNGSDESGFNGLPGGYRNYDGLFDAIGLMQYCWSSTEFTESKYLTGGAWYRLLRNYSDNVKRHCYNFECGFSVRCVKNN